MRNTYLKDVRTQLSDSRYTLPPPLSQTNPYKLTYRLFFGKTKVMAVALGPPTSPTHLLTPHLHGTVGLLFSPRPPPAILTYFSTFSPLDYARAGSPAARSFTLPAGPLYSRAGEIPIENDVPVAQSLEPTLRKLGVPTRLVKGAVELDGEFMVCREGEVLGSGQTTLLKMFGVAMAEFRVGVEAYWERGTGEVTVVGEGKADGGGIDVEGEEDGDVEVER